MATPKDPTAPSFTETLQRVKRRTFKELVELSFYASDVGDLMREIDQIADQRDRVAAKIKLLEIRQGDARLRLDALQKVNKYVLRNVPMEDLQTLKADVTREAKLTEIRAILATHHSLLASDVPTDSTQ